MVKPSIISIKGNDSYFTVPFFINESMKDSLTESFMETIKDNPDAKLIWAEEFVEVTPEDLAFELDCYEFIDKVRDLADIERVRPWGKVNIPRLKS